MQRHSLNSLPVPMKQDSLNSAYIRLRETGEIKAAQEIILGHTRLAVRLASGFARRCPDRYDDLISEALLKLTSATWAMARGTIDHHKGAPNVTGYLIMHILGALRRAIRPERKIEILKEETKAVPFLTDLDTREAITLATHYDRRSLFVIYGRESGLNDAQIAKSLGVSKQYVYLIRRRVEQEYIRITA